MTLQVCLIAKDGYVMASDLKVIHQGQPRHSSHESKIYHNENLGLSWCGAGDDMARIAGDLLRERVLTENVGLANMRSVLESIGAQAWKKRNGSSHEDAIRALIERDISALGSRELTVTMCNDEGTRAWRLLIYGAAIVHCEEIFDKSIAGDTTNPVTFFMEFYGNGQRTIEELKMLAATIILLGGRLNPEGIDGLEMVICSKGKMQKIDSQSQEIADLTARVKRLSVNIASLLFQEINS